MDSFINLAKQGIEAYEGRHSDSNQSYGKTGGAEYNAPHSGQYQGSDGPEFDHDEVARRAEEHGSGDRSLFTSAMSFVQQNKHQQGEPIDEQAVQDSHRKAYSEGNAGSLDAGSLGAAAAMQALKKFTSGGGNSGGGSQSELISLAMSEATKLFESSGGAASGGKQDATNSAAMTVMKLLVQSKFSGAVGGGNSGGLGSLMGLASKFI